MVFIAPELIAVRLTDASGLNEGTTHPVRLICVKSKDINQENEYIVKFASRLALNGLGVALELICGNLAKYFNLSVPDFGKVKITEALRDAAYSNISTPSMTLESLNQNIDCVNFGSLDIGTGLILPLASQNFSGEQKSMAEKIFAFDGLIYNADRTLDNPNLFQKGEDFIIFDHERAFNFLFQSPIRVPEILNFRTPDNESFLHKHFFFQSIKTKKEKVDFSHFVADLKNLDDNIIEEIYSQVPMKLNQDHQKALDKVKEHLVNCRNHANTFQQNLLRVLA